MGLLIAQLVKNLPAMQETWVRFLGQEDPLEKEMATHSSTLGWRTHGQMSLAGYRSWGYEESDATEHTHYVPIKQLEFLKIHSSIKQTTFNYKELLLIVT